MVHGLTHLREYWSSLVRRNRAKLLKIDVHTIQTLQLLAPGVSTKDRATAKGLVLGGVVFSNFTQSERSSIWKKMKKKDNIIPSLYTFFQNMRYLESCADCMKRLIGFSQYRTTVKSAMRGIFKPADPASGECLIQTSETGFRQYSDRQADHADLGYRQLWLYAMRHYPNLAKEPTSDDRVAKPSCEKADETALYDMAVLAQKLGFDSRQITNLINQSPDRQIARAALLKARKPDRYRYDSDSFESFISTMAGFFSRAVPIDHETTSEQIDGREVRLNARCGRPHAKAQKQDRQFLFIDSLHTNEFQTAGKISSLFVRRYVYISFFGKPQSSFMHGSTNAANDHLEPESCLSPLFVPLPEPGDATDENISHVPRSNGGHDGDRQRRGEARRERQEKHRRQRRQREHQQQRQRRRQNPSRIERRTSATSSVAADTAASIQSDVSSSTSQQSSPLLEEVEERMSLNYDEPVHYGAHEEASDEEAESEQIETQTDSLGQFPVDPETLGTDAGDYELPRTEEAHAAAEQAERERLVRETAEREAAEREAAERAEQERLAREAAEREAAEREAAERAEQERLAREAAEREAAEREAAEREAAERAEQERLARETAEREAAEREATERAEQERLAREAAEREAAEREAAERAEQERLAREAAEREAAERAEQERLPTREDLTSVTSGNQGETRGQTTQGERSPKRITQLNFAAALQPEDSGGVLTTSQIPNPRPLEAISEHVAPQFRDPVADIPATERKEGAPIPPLPTKCGTSSQEKQALPANHEGQHLEDHNQNDAAEHVDEDLLQMLQSQAEHRALGEQSADNGSRLETQPSQNTEQEEGGRVAQERATALAQLEAESYNNSAPPHDDGRGLSQSAELAAVPGAESMANRTPLPSKTDAVEQDLSDRLDKEATATEPTNVPGGSSETAAPLKGRQTPKTPSEQHRSRPPRPLGIKKAKEKVGKQSPYKRPAANTDASAHKIEKPGQHRRRPLERLTQLDFARLAENKGGELRPENLQGTSSTPQEVPSTEPTVGVNPNVNQNAIASRRKLRPRIPAGTIQGVSLVHHPPKLQHGTSSESIRIVFKARDEHGEWEKVIHELDVDPSDPSSVERVAKKDARNQKATFYDKDLRIITPAQCFHAAIEDGINTIFMTYGEELSVDEETVASVSRSLDADREREERAKRRRQ